MSNETFMGRLYSYDPVQNTILVKIDFIDIEQQDILEKLYADQNMFTFSFKKAYRQNKQYHQLKYYYSMLKKILIKFDLEPDSKTLRAFNEEIMKTCTKCDFIQVEDKKIPVIPSKADMSYEEMEALNKIVESRYSKFLDNNIVGE